MPLFSFEGRSPQVDPSAFIAPTATLVGEVYVEAGASVWYGAVVRGDFSPVYIRAGANVQDNSVLHCPGGSPCDIGPGVTVAHACVVHGAVVEEGALVANHSTVLDGARIGARSLIAAHSLVSAGAQIPPGVLAAGAPAVVRRELEAGTPAERLVANNATSYANLAQRHRTGVVPI